MRSGDRLLISQLGCCVAFQVELVLSVILAAGCDSSHSGNSEHIVDDLTRSIRQKNLNRKICEPVNPRLIDERLLRLEKGNRRKGRSNPPLGPVLPVAPFPASHSPTKASHPSIPPRWPHRFSVRHTTPVVTPRQHRNLDSARRIS